MRGHGIVLDQTVGSWLDDLASEAPAPGGGAAAAMNAAVGAGLVAMVCNLTIGKPRYAEHEPLMRRVLASVTDLRAQAVQLAADDAVAFSAVTDAYKLPKDTDADKAARTEAIQAALIGAADVPLRTAAVAAAIIGHAEQIIDGANVNVLSDVAVAAASARAALDSAVINVEINLGAMKDAAQRDSLRTELAKHAAAIDTATAVVSAVRERING
ncbi:cyclodeaminase/cyclohydrolase family protein [Actinoplanes sp. NPDC020271]|uniref:cyclodeaminase/cyclohydrolase family protein n=1 Tax=Actinoplanes sp. NPDC020271 TaxID=3363896 RepID=UPI0037AE0689